MNTTFPIFHYMCMRVHSLHAYACKTAMSVVEITRCNVFKLMHCCLRGMQAPHSLASTQAAARAG